MQQRPINVLLVEHDPQPATDLRDALEANGSASVEIERSNELAGALERLSRGGVDVVLLDLDLPDSQGIGTFERTYAFAPDVPIVVLTSRDEEDLALATMQGGAQDHLVREDATPAVLVRSLRYAVERHRLLSALKSLSLIDELTGLYNRRGFAELGDRYLKLARRNERDVTLVYLDLDRFRTINDSLGHHVGDRALMKVADILRATFRRSDVMARINGDEFAVLALEASGENAEALVERVKDRLREFNASGREPYQLHASIALARHTGEGPVRLEELLADADGDMHESKSRRTARTP